ncbi:MAG: 5-oxoprolinase subunit PxpB [Pyrinomonadaceae bacterium]
MKHEFYSVGEGALTISFGNVITPVLNDRVRGLNQYLLQNQFSGFIEAVPAYSSLTIFYDVCVVRRAFPTFETAFAAVQFLIENAVLRQPDLMAATQRLIRIPVCYDEEFGLDLEFVAASKNLSPAEIVQIHTSRNYRVFMLGFLPGFPYLGETDERIAIGRKSEPRLSVPRGSVGIAGKQTGIYSLQSPGGWQIIGKTPLSIFNPRSQPPTLLQAGDTVEFYKIERDEFDHLAKQ